MEPLTHVDAPGAYPSTPVNEEPTLQTTRNKLHKREDPRALGANLPQKTHPAGYNSTGSGVGANEPYLALTTDHPASSHHNPPQYTPFNNNDETPVNLGNDAQSKRHRYTDSGIDVDDSPFSRETSKPGLMTGAYSRVGTRDSAFAPIGDYAQDKASISHPANAMDSQQYVDTRSSGTVKNPTASANPAAEYANLDLESNTTANSHAAHRDNEAQSSTRVDSNTKHNEPYWGDIPFGVGVYNGVTGHGSNEPIAHQKSLHDQDDTTANSRVYNGITGHGSKESTSPQMTRQDRGNAVNDSSRGQREFPLDNSKNTTAATNLNNSDEHGRDSHFKEALAGAGATAAGGYATHEYLNRDDKKSAKATEDKRASEKSSEMGQGRFDAILHPLRHTKNDRIADHNEEKHTVTQDSLAAAPVKDYNVVKSSSKQPDSTENEKASKDKSNVGYYGAAATAAAAGAGIYGHEHANRDSSKEHTSTPESKAPSAAAIQTAGRDSPQKIRQSLGNDTPTQNVGREQSQSHVTSNGTPSAIASRGAKQPSSASRSDPSHSNVPSSDTSSGIITGRRKAAEQSSADRSHAGQYNMLSSGTPSGINLAQAHPAKEQNHGEQTSVKFPPALPASQRQIVSTGQTLRDDGGDPSARVAAQQTQGETNFGSTTNESRDEKKNNSHIAGAVMGAGAGALAAGGLASSGPTSSRKVMHRCTKCGEENDISHYMMN
ncbi:hypothetical protein GGS24DRAFT_511614 [Hypoxylon argillaceum]|nr:hypothetical protein GGS24DRAFT_511614 [Hypoxylon argillaceum]